MLLISASVFIFQNAHAESVDPKFHKRITKIGKMLVSDNYSKALTRIEPLLKYAKSNTYEGALVHQLAGYVYLGLGQHKKAIKHFNECIENNKLPKQLNQEIRLLLAQLYLTTSQNKLAEKLYEEWVSRAQNTNAIHYALGGSVYIATHSFDKAEEYLKNATKNKDESNESWLKMLLYIYYEKKKYEEASHILEILIAKNPIEIDYWRRLSDIKYKLGDINSALAVMQIAYQNNLLTQENDLLRLTSLLSQYNLPNNAGNIIDKSILKNKLIPTPPLINTLFHTYYSAKENGYATQNLTKYSDANTHPLLFIQAAYQYIENENWGKAEELLQLVNNNKAVYPETYLGLAIIKIYQDKYEDARKWLKSALKHESTRKSATEWGNYLEKKSQ